MRKVILKLFIAIVYTAPLALEAQDVESTISLKSNGISLGLLGAPTWPLGITYDQMLSDRVSFELGVGVLSSGIGFNYYFTNPRHQRLNLFSGMYGSVNYSGYPMFYLPIGLSYLGKNNFEYSLDIGPLYSENVSTLENGSIISPFLGLKVGYRFGEDIDILKSKEKTNLKNIVSLKMGLTDPWLSVVYERLLTPYFGTEVSIGLLGASLGANFYLPALKDENTGFKIGVILARSANPFDENDFKAYVPLGLYFLTKNSVIFNIDGGPQYLFYDNEILVGASIKIGKVF
jgi:hypothetical protein